MMIKTEGFLLDDVTSTSRSTSYPITTHSLDSSTEHSCGNKLNTCSQYGPSVCTTAAYQPWAKDNCALYCNFCISPDLQNFCKDKIDNCAEYDSGDLCTNPTYYTWMYDNCRDYCRLDTCGNTCLDSPSANCSMLNATIGLCSSIHQAKVICRNYCDLCNVTDGHWCAWSDWGSCDATCANGIQSRTRQCGCPAASNGGLDCVGNVNSDYKPCINNPCPVNGEWSIWTNWGSCSSTCGIGMQRRDRRCSNPVPSMGGLQCLGDAHEDRICFASACADGHWSGWGYWSSCSQQCGGGIRKRSRTCTNPRPSLTGRYCDGNSDNVQGCNTQLCHEPTPVIAFSVHDVTYLSPGSSNPVVFKTVSLNAGNCYNTSTGYFTATVSGVYQFNAQLCVNKGTDLEYAIITVNGFDIARGEYRASSDSIDEKCTSFGAVGIVRRGQRAEVRGWFSSLKENNDDWNSFSGVLINPL